MENNDSFLREAELRGYVLVPADCIVLNKTPSWKIFFQEVGFWMCIMLCLSVFGNAVSG